MMKAALISGKLSEMEMSSLSSDRGKSHGHHNSGAEQQQQQQQDIAENARKHASSSHRGGGLFGAIQQPPQQTKRLGRTPSSPSVFFSKVKERIREKVYETSAEWPHMAAIVQERRQRAADAFEARMSIHRQNAALQGHGGNCGNESDAVCDESASSHKGRRVRIKSDQTVHHRASPSNSSGGGSGGGGSGGCTSVSNSFDKDGAKSAFRRRSISEDTYNRQPGSCTQQHPEDRGGVVCSNDELRAIVFEHKLRRSPVALKYPEKGSGSLECCQESTISCDSLSNNSVTSNPKLHACRADCAHFPPTSARESPPVLSHSSSATQQQQGFIADGVNSGRNSCRVSLTITGADDVKTSDPLLSESSSSDQVGSDTRRNSVVIREVVFDEHGQTWDIYGAEFDPEILGQAIQSHLEKIMKKKLVDRSNVVEPALCLRSDSPNECRPMCVNDERRTQRAFGFFLRYLCSVAKRKEQVTG